MAYVRGTGTVEVELSKTQSWIEQADVDLYGRNGDAGLVREHRDDRASEAQRRADNDAHNRRVLTWTALLGVVFPVLIELLKLARILP